MEVGPSFGLYHFLSFGVRGKRLFTVVEILELTVCSDIEIVIDGPSTCLLGTFN